jgi:hypothetical protein
MVTIHHAGFQVLTAIMKIQVQQQYSPSLDGSRNINKMCVRIIGNNTMMISTMFSLSVMCKNLPPSLWMPSGAQYDWNLYLTQGTSLPGGHRT